MKGYFVMITSWKRRMNRSLREWMSKRRTYLRKKEKKRKKRKKKRYVKRDWSNLHATGKNIFSSNYISSSKKALWKFIDRVTGVETSRPTALCRRKKSKEKNSPSAKQVKMQMTMAAPRIIPYFSIKRHLFLFVSARDTAIPPKNCPINSRSLRPPPALAPRERAGGRGWPITSASLEEMRQQEAREH